MVWLSADCDTPSLRRRAGEAALARDREKGQEVVDVRRGPFMNPAHEFMPILASNRSAGDVA